MDARARDVQGSRATYRRSSVSIIPVRDPEDTRIADYRNVPDPALIAQRGLFVAEGRLVVERLLASARWTARSALVTETALASVRSALDRHADLPVYVVEQDIMNRITGFNIHRGCLALAERRALADWRTLAAGAGLLVILERLGNADNVGSIFRHAAAFDVDAVLLGPACADPLYRKAIRTSMGAALAMPFADAVPWPGALSQLREDGWAVVALTPSSRMTLREAASILTRRRTAIVVGHEGEGLTADASAACEYHARIPMAGGVDSLNVATATAIALYEFNEAGREAPPYQRGAALDGPPGQ
jgi:tRNA G18 (ribose-2'-O)-methylase SpoU